MKIANTKRGKAGSMPHVGSVLRHPAWMEGVVCGEVGREGRDACPRAPSNGKKLQKNNLNLNLNFSFSTSNMDISAMLPSPPHKSRTMNAALPLELHSS